MRVIDWLLEGDPAIRWQALRDLSDASPEEVAAERGRVEHDGWAPACWRSRAPTGCGRAGPVSRPATAVANPGSHGLLPPVGRGPRSPDGRGRRGRAVQAPADGRWLLERVHPGRVHFDLEGGVGAPSRWNTLRALRVLDWWDRDR